MCDIVVVTNQYAVSECVAFVMIFVGVTLSSHATCVRHSSICVCTPFITCVRLDVHSRMLARTAQTYKHKQMHTRTMRVRCRSGNLCPCSHCWPRAACTNEHLFSWRCYSKRTHTSHTTFIRQHIHCIHIAQTPYMHILCAGFFMGPASHHQENHVRTRLCRRFYDCTIQYYYMCVVFDLQHLFRI